MALVGSEGFSESEILACDECELYESVETHAKETRGEHCPVDTACAPQNREDRVPHVHHSCLEHGCSVSSLKHTASLSRISPAASSPSILGFATADQLPTG